MVSWYFVLNSTRSAFCIIYFLVKVIYLLFEYDRSVHLDRPSFILAFSVT